MVERKDEERPREQPWAALDKTRERGRAQVGAKPPVHHSSFGPHEATWPQAVGGWEMQIARTALGDGFGPGLLSRNVE
jgi:hypothetical protein